MRAFISRSKAWIKKGSSYWLVLILYIAVIVLSYKFMSNSDWLNWFRVIGIFIEILGLWIVVFPLSRESRENGHIGYHKGFLLWCCDIKSIFVSKNATAICTGSATLASVGGTATATVSRNFDTLDEKVDYLMQVVEGLTKSVADNMNRVEQVRNELSGEIGKLDSMFSQKIVKIQDELKDKATKDYNLLVSGAYLTVLGMFMTNLPDDILHTYLRFALKAGI